MMETMNKFLVGMRGSQIAFPLGLPAAMSKDDALLLSAWIVALADEDGKFAKLLAEVQST